MAHRNFRHTSLRQTAVSRSDTLRTHQPFFPLRVDGTPDTNYRDFHLALRTLYGNTVELADNDNFNSVSAAFKKAMEYIHKQKKYQPEMLADKSVLALINATNDVLSKELDNLSVKHDVPEDLVSTLRKNVFFFSGFKTHHELTEASRMLQSEDGGFKSFEKFYEDVKTIDKTYNRNYLKAEYNFATASTQMAVKWKEWEKSADRYDLQYRTAGDDRVREEHEALDGITLPMTDPFWNEYLPPMGWNCRCTAVRVRKGKYPTSDSDEAIQKGKNCTSKPKQQIFRFNPGKQEKIFPPKHPYFPKGCGDCEYKLSYDKNNPNCQACKTLLQNMENDIKRREENRKEYERLKKDPDYTNVEYDGKTGGVKAEHIGHIDHHDDKEEHFFRYMTNDGKGLTSTQLERYCQAIIFRSGHKAILRNEKTKSTNGDQLPALDLELDTKIMDIASVTTAEKYGNILMSKNKQLGNVKKKTGYQGDSVCLYFHDPKSFSESTLVHDIDWYKNNIEKVGSKQRIRHIYVVINGKRELKIYDV